MILLDLFLAHNLIHIRELIFEKFDHLIVCEVSDALGS